MIILLIFSHFSFSNSLDNELNDLEKSLEQAQLYFNQQNYEQALIWFEKSALQGEAEAQYNLGLMYAQGNGVSQDYIEAYVWFHLSEVNGYIPAKEYKNATAKRLTSEQLALAQQKSTSAAQHIQ